MELFTDKPELVSDYMELFDSNFSIMMVGYHNFHHIKPFKKKRWQKFHTLHFVLSGHGYFEIYGKKYRLGQHEMFLIPPDVNVSYYPDPKDPWSYAWIDFIGDIFTSNIIHYNIPNNLIIFSIRKRNGISLFSNDV